MSRSCCCGMDPLPLTPYWHMGSLPDPSYHRCKNRVYLLEAQGEKLVPYCPVSGSRRAPSAGASPGEPQLGGHGGQAAGPGTENCHLGKEPCPSSIPLSVPRGAAAGGGGRGAGPGQYLGGSCLGVSKAEASVLCACFPPPPPFPSLFIDSASYSAETNLRFSQVPGPAAACIISQAAIH